jgi:hypothetical protein
MSTAHHRLIQENQSLLLSDPGLPVFSIRQETLAKIREFRSSHPTITVEFFDRELNAALVEMLYRMEREFQGEK